MAFSRIAVTRFLQCGHRCSGLVLGCGRRRLIQGARCSSSAVPPQPPSAFPDIQIPDNVSLAQHMLQSFPKHQNLVAFVNGVTGQSTTYGELLTQVTRVSSALVKLGLRPGDVVNIFSPNSPEFAVLFLAVVAAGGVVSAVNPLYTANELSRTLDHSEAKYIATIPELLPVVKQAVASTPDIKEIIVFGEADKCRPFSSLLQDDGKAFPENLESCPQEDVACLPYSSGTTGLPKGVMLSNYNVVSNVEQLCCKIMFDLTPGEHTFIGVLPFFHIYGQVVSMLTGLISGVKIVTMPKFDPELYLNTVQSHKVTHLHVVPPMVLFLAKHPMVAKYDLSSVQMAVTGAAPASPDAIEAFVKRMDSSTFLFRQGFGLTEASPVTHSNSHDNIKWDTVGQRLSNVKQKIVDVETGETLGFGQEGELCVKGPNVMLGYLKNPEATQDTIKDGWLHTGDIGYCEEDGHVRITDRLKELIKYKGFQVAPAELENLLVTHPAIASAAVIGLPDERAGELPRAYVVLRPDAKLSEEDVHKFVAGKVAPYKELSGGVEFRDSIPVSATGKILRRELKAELKDKAT